MTLIKIGLLKMDGCGGCISSLFQHKHFPEIMDKFEFIDLSKHEKNVDHIIIEGCTKKENAGLIERLSKKAKSIVLFGSCANDCFKFLNLNDNKDNSLKINADLKVVGCPVSDFDIYDLFSSLAIDRTKNKVSHPVCKECSERFVKCLLNEGKECLGHETVGNCSVICPKIGVSCIGCRTSLLEKEIDKNGN